MQKDSVLLQKIDVTYNAARIATQDWSDVRKLTGTLLPVAGNTLQKDWGLSTDADFLFFTKDNNEFLKVGNRIVAGQTTLYISAVLDYKKIRQVELKGDLNG